MVTPRPSKPKLRVRFPPDAVAFYSPKVASEFSVPVILYRDESAESFHLECLSHAVSQIRADADYVICFVWEDEGDPMIDCWEFWQTNTWGSGPLSSVRVYRGKKATHDIGVASGNTLIVLGLEEQARRESSSLQEYLAGVRPALPASLMFSSSVTERFK